MAQQKDTLKKSSTTGVDSEGSPQRFDRYELLIDSAATIFQRNGYAATSLQQIADEVGILKGSLYHYIKTKEDLLFAVIKRNHEHIIENNSAWRDEQADPIAAIRSFIQGHIRASLWNPTYSEVFVRDFRALSPDRSQEIRETQEQYGNEFRALIAEAVNLGQLRDGVEPVFAARAIFGMTNSISVWYEHGGPMSADDVVEQLSEYAVASLLEPKEATGKS